MTTAAMKSGVGLHPQSDDAHCTETANIKIILYNGKNEDYSYNFPNCSLALLSTRR
jgi:hypothetical protein